MMEIQNNMMDVMRMNLNALKIVKFVIMEYVIIVYLGLI